ncbi:MAG: PDZ domain-containing protein [Acidobacteria bacterium]|nr:PDZ domain-containing protein [Acidobacteriota bacterium]MBV9927590.1 PDZ domain-containing protein [Acidobacteriota bacterium]
MRAENIVNCPSCGATLVAGLRFCRMCGYRLGEGVEEFVPTQRLDPAAAPTAAQAPPATDPFRARQTWGNAPIQPFGANTTLGRAQPEGATSKLARACSRARGGWWLWLTIIVVLMVAGGMLPAAIRTRGGGGAAPAVVRSFLGVDGFDNAPGGGAFIEGIAGPETPIVRANLIGGDTIIKFDGKDVRGADDINRILRDTPVGKTVEVVYIRDGVTATTTLTTAAQNDTPGMRMFDRRQLGHGVLGVNVGDRVQVPNSNIFGVELDDVQTNRPADIAGLRENDIVIKFGDYLIRTPGDLRYRIAEAMPGSTIPVTVVRGTEQLEIQVKVGRSKD